MKWTKQLSKWQIEWLRREFQAEIDRELGKTSDGATNQPDLDDDLLGKFMQRFTNERSHWLRVLGNAGSSFAAVFNAANRIAFGQNLREWRNIGLENRLWEEGEFVGDGNFKIPVRTIYPFKRIPNARSFEIELGPFHALFALFGIKKRWKPFLKFHSYRNAKLNRYLVHQCIRLERCLKCGNNTLYWAISKALIKRSNVFFIEQLNRTCPNWHRNMPLWAVKRLYRQVRALGAAPLNTLSVKYHRVFIPKAGGKHRPLGVPELQWRVFLGLWNSFTVKFSHDQISMNQHAFVPGRGTLTCWRQLISLYSKYPDIVEFDLNKWFDKVDLDFLKKALIRRNFPSDVVSFFDGINSKLPHGIYFLEGHDTSLEEIAEVYEPFQPMSLHLDALKAGRKRKGVAQGMPLSPFLSNIVLEDTIFPLFNTENSELLMYADDGLVFCDFNKLTEDQRWFLFESWPLPGGVKTNPSKTFKVRRSNVWFRPLKFLGLQIWEGQLSANTRKGSRLVNDKWELIDLLENPDDYELVDDWSRPKGKVASLHNLLKSKAFGLIQARLYYGKWNLDELRQDFTYSFNKHSWAWFARNSKKLDYGHGLNVFNSSSYACFFLLDILSRVKWDKQIVPSDTVLMPDLTQEEHAEAIESIYEGQRFQTLVDEIQEEWEGNNLQALIAGQRKGLTLREIVESIPGTVIETEGRTGYMKSYLDFIKAGKTVGVGIGTTPKEFKRINAEFNERGLTYPLAGPSMHHWLK
jgi:hypothetical protein